MFYYTKFPTYIHSFSPSLLFLINLHKMLSNHSIKIETLSFEDFKFSVINHSGNPKGEVKLAPSKTWPK